MGQFAKNQWYAAAWSSEVQQAPLGRKILGQSIVLFRDADGKPSALLDRCPHRLVPLSLGTCTDKGLQCGYHGMVFNGDGTCVHIPGQDMIPPKAKVESFPLEEKYDMLWIWMGARDKADPALLPDIPNHGKSEWEMIGDGYQHHPSNYLNIIENLMDPAHTTFVHKQTIGNPAAANVPVHMKRTDQYIVSYKWIENSPPTPIDLAAKDFADSKVDRGIYFYCYLPTMSLVDIVTIPAGSERTEENFNQGIRNNSYKFLTPESETSTHFFWMHLRNYKIGDHGFSDKMRGIFEKTFLEDRVIEMAMQEWQDKIGVRQFVALEIDRAPKIALRMIDRMVKEEEADLLEKSQ